MKLIYKVGKVLVCAWILGAGLAAAQVEVKAVQQLGGDASGANEDGKLDLGTTPGDSGATTTAAATGNERVSASAPASTIGAPPPAGTSPASAARQRASARTEKPHVSKPKLLGALDDSAFGPSELGQKIQRVQFDRSPVKVNMAVNVERQVTFPNPVALHVPAGSEGLIWSQVIERTAYLRALQPLAGTRVIAEDLVTGQMLPVDLFADELGGSAPGELEVFYKKAADARTARTGRQHAEGDGEVDDADEPPIDMVGLTRYAAQVMYAPKRLLPSAPGVYPVPVQPIPFNGLVRGQRISAMPMGQWRSGSLFVTAVRLTNQEARPVDLDLDQLRGTWLAATPQHRRLLQAGTSWSTTTLYLVCAGAFETCR